MKPFKLMSARKMNTADQRSNRDLALALVAMGVYVFPSDNKNPLVPGWPKPDTSFTPEQKAHKIAEFEQKHKYKPAHVGCTIDKVVVKRLWTSFPNAVPSISCGPSKLFVVDADIHDGKDGKRVKNGPNLLGIFLADNQIAIEGALIVETRSGGKHLYFRDHIGLDSKAGTMRDLDCDIRGIGGQTVAPGAVRSDGKRYRIVQGELSDLLTVAEIPAGIVTAVRTARVSTEVCDEETASLIAHLHEADVPAFDAIFDPIMGRYDLETLAKKDKEFAELWAKGSKKGDTSSARMMMSRCLQREWPQLKIEELLSFYGGWVYAGEFTDEKSGSGTYNFRDVAREYQKGRNEHRVSTGEAFGAVDDLEELLLDEPSRLKAAEAVAEAIESERAAREQATEPLFTTDRDLVEQYVPKEWLVKKLIPLWGIGAIYGQPNSGKSFLIYDLLSRAARGMDFLGRKTRKRAGLYFNAEGVHTFVGRAKAWRDFHLSAPVGLVSVATNMPSFLKPNTARNEIERIIDAVEAMHNEKIGVLVFDTWAALTAGLDEIATGTATSVTRELRKIVKKRGLCVIIVHHSTKADSANMRGTGALLGEIDFSFEVRECKSAGAIEIIGHKQREEQKGAPLAFKLKVVVIGKDEDGDDDTSCVVMPLNVSSGNAMTGVVEEGCDAPRFRAADDGRANEAAVLDVIQSIVKGTLMDGEHRADIQIAQREVLARWNNWRAERDDLKGVPLKKCDDGQLIRVIKRLEANKQVRRLTVERRAKLSLI